ncbi:hypothetical protein NIE88_09715 [Sporolactobacillus shoreicorticis]|uniref:Uncharacterized protein n=1 Tax=Sporolactobacillus shoreicorticis TaxID=1923877 RepID=A0ABW5S9J8_9BACL|nr:hypothetical protein [Sporolactobacillus shoreicorticis]MCO7126052.1 hypothetical protein [Sporolactobacillus shoreicorticis]
MVFIIVLCLIATYISVLTLLAYIDSKTDYSDPQIRKFTDLKGNFYFFARYYLWQPNKLKKIKSSVPQNSFLYVENYIYQVHDYGENYQVPDGLFFEREIRFFGKPLILEKSNNNPEITINQYGDGVLQLNLVSNVLNQIEELTQNNIDISDKKILEDFIIKIKDGNIFNEKEVKSVYEALLRNIPFADFALNLITAIKTFFGY